MTKRVRAFLNGLKQELRARYAEPVAWQGAWLRRKIAGYFQYHAVPGNLEALNTVRREANRLWLRTLRRRSQKHRMPWARLQGLVRRWIPNVRVIHPYPSQRFAL